MYFMFLIGLVTVTSSVKHLKLTCMNGTIKNKQTLPNDDRLQANLFFCEY